MLTTKQKSKLRSIAMTKKSIFQIGKEGISNNLIDGLKAALEAHELIKINVLKNCFSNIKEVAFDIASATNSEIVQIIGRNIVLYRQSKKQLIQF